VRREYSSADRTTTVPHPCTVTCCGPSLCALRMSSESRALASCRGQLLGPLARRGPAGRGHGDQSFLVRTTRIGEVTVDERRPRLAEQDAADGRYGAGAELGRSYSRGWRVQDLKYSKGAVDTSHTRCLQACGRSEGVKFQPNDKLALGAEEISVDMYGIMPYVDTVKK
jgi:hypothetical protein